jgi:class 3 adenylate cyclase
MTTVREPTSFESGVGGLPRGTVTFLFTDIEGSTKLLTRLRERYAEALSQHRSILGAAAAANAGHEIDSKGDSCFFAFARANDAVAAAVAAQRALAEHPWPEGGAVRVRMGLHTGEPAVDDRSYVGLGVHRAARIGAAAHGGQILLSSATRELTEEVDGVSMRELGLYRLKDIDRPERLFQIDIEGLQTAFPPLSAESVAEPSRLRRRTVRAAALACAIGAAISIPVLALSATGGERVRAAAGDSVGVVDPRADWWRISASERRPRTLRSGKAPTGSRMPTATPFRGSMRRGERSSRRSASAAARVGSRPGTVRSGWRTAWTALSRGSIR